MKTLLYAVAVVAGLASLARFDVNIALSTSITVDSLGACQGASYLDGKAYLYGDREVGMIRTYNVGKDALTYTGAGNQTYRRRQRRYQSPYRHRLASKKANFYR